MHVILLSPIKGACEVHDVLSVSFKGVTGECNVLPHHAEMISVLKKGYVFFRMEDCFNFVEIEAEGAIVHVKDDIVKILV
ncbi:MAG: hypothetical protein II393_03090 [Cytophagales bacterium]|nr:hypothetical protein [Cytophagales bacterium]